MFILIDPLVYLFGMILWIPIKIALWIGYWLLIGAFYVGSFLLAVMAKLLAYLMKQLFKLAKYGWSRFYAYLISFKDERSYDEQDALFPCR